MKKRIIPGLLVLALAALTACGKNELKLDIKYPADAETAEPAEPVPKPMEDFASFENCDIPETSPAEVHYGMAAVAADYDGGSEILIDIKEVILVGWDDTELIEKYGLDPDVDMANDYALVEKDTEFCPYIAYRDATVFHALGTESGGTDAFLDRMKKSADQGGMLISYTLEPGMDGSDAVLKMVNEVYVP